MTQTTWTIAGTFVTASGGTNGASVDGWRAARFGSVPAEGTSPPSGSADTFQVLTSTSFGGPGAFQLSCYTNEQYYVRIQYSGTTYWGLHSPVLNAAGVANTNFAGGQTDSMIQDAGGQVYNVLHPYFGADPTGVADSTAAIEAAINACAAGNNDTAGGTVYFPPGIYRVTQTINLPVSNIESDNPNNEPQTPIYISAPLRITGAGGNSSPRGDGPDFGSAIYFDPTANSTLFNGVGEGTFEFDHMAIVDISSQENLFFFVNNTSTNIHDCAFRGNNEQTSAWTDVIQYGGIGAEYPRGDTLGIYQGQCSTLMFNSCTQIRHLALLYSQASDILISHNGMYNTCGTNLANDAPVVVVGPGAVGNYFEYNDFEMGSFNIVDDVVTRIPIGYAYAIKFNDGYDSMIIGNNVGDANTAAGGGAPPYAVANYYFGSGSTGNTVIQGNSTPISITLPWAAGNAINNMNTIALPQFISGGAGGVIEGPVYAAGAYPFFTQAGTQVVTTNDEGYGAISFPAIFPNGLVAITCQSNGDNNTPDGAFSWVGQVVYGSTGGFYFYLQNATGPRPNVEVAVTWTAIGD